MRDLAAWLIALVALPALAHASRLPVKTYTTADGLARDSIQCIVQDSHGFLWFCTAEGLSRFDGYQFTNYRTEHGLPSNVVTDLLESHQGVYWIATSGGLARFDPRRGSGPSGFHRYPLSAGTDAAEPTVLYQDHDGGIWCGTYKGLFHLGPKDPSFRRVDLGVTDSSVSAILLDRRGTLWIGSPTGLYRRGADGNTTSYARVDGISSEETLYIMGLIEDHEGRIWVATRVGLIRMDADPGPTLGRQSRVRVYTRKDGLPSNRIESLFQAADGRLWVATNGGLAEWRPGQDRAKLAFRSYTMAQGLSDRALGAVAEDRDGNLWVGTWGSGAMKVARSGFTTYSETDGIRLTRSLVESRHGEMCALYYTDAGLFVARFDGTRFVPIRPDWPKSITYWGWGSEQIALQDRAGEWWIATGKGLCRFGSVTRVDQLARARPKAVYTTRDGLPGDKIFRLFEDSRSNIWIGTENGLARWDRVSGRMHPLAEADGLPPHPVPTAFAEDRSGDLWVCLFNGGGIARYSNGRFTTFNSVPGWLNTMFIDSAGRLWIGTSRGLVRVEDPTQQQPRFITYGPAQGLSSNYIAAITEDRWGRIYAATGRGIDRFEPQAQGIGRIKHYTTADGIAAGELRLALRDREGTLWFATSLGVSQYVPTVDRPQAAPPVLVTGLSTGGVPQQLSELGQATVSGLRFSRSPLRIDFVGLGFSPGETLRYQYMLEGAEHDWSAPTDQRAVLYASLAAGNYRFLVRAAASDGAVSPRPATVAFTILPPLWRTWWFLSACGLAAMMIVYALYRIRLAQLLAVANVRTRIAVDLHDDIGASLSQIAILSEIAQRGTDRTATQERNPLSEIAGIARELVDSIGDIVWAINPDHDHLSNLVYRMRRFATDLLGNHNIGLQFRSSVADHDLRTGADVRRQLYLIFKEGIHNIARHSGASQAEVELERVDNGLWLVLKDNGRGFDPASQIGGHGLLSIRRRATALGGKVDVRSTPGEGSALTVSVPLESARTLSILRGK